jgi:putative drug exporter of the RND superfamily
MSNRRPFSSSSPPSPPETAPASPLPDGEPPAVAGRSPDVATPVDEFTAAPWPWRLYAGVTAYLGLPIIAAWIVACFAATAFLPDVGADTGFGLVELIPGNTAALHAQAVENRLFGVSLSDAQSVVVVHDPQGLGADTLVKLGQQAQALDASPPPPSSPPSRPSFVLPLVNVPGLVPASQGTATTAVVYLFFRSNATSGDITAGSRRYAAAAPHPPGASIGITGSVPAQITEGNTIENSLLLLELVTVAVIAVLVGVVFRSPIAPIVPLAGSAIAYLATRHVLGWGAHAFGVQIPSQLAPIMVVLILGVVTDYSVFTLTGMRARLAAGERRTTALRQTSSRVVPLVVAAALTVAAGTIALLGANLDFFHAVGPGMAVAVVISGLVSISFTPALVGVLGRLAFWPSLRRPRTATRARPLPGSNSVRQLIARLLSRRLVAAIAVVICTGVLVLAASGLSRARLGSNVLSGLPSGSPPRQAAANAAAGFVPGIVAPATLILEAPGIAAQTGRIGQVEQVISRSPGVAGVAGPGQLPLDLGASLFRTSDGNAVRLIVVFRDDPYDALAIAAFNTVQTRVNGALAGAGLGVATASWSGATATAAEAVAGTESDIWRVALAAAVLMSLVLALYFRAVLAPLLLVASSALALAATLGLLVDVFQGALGYADITFFVPMAAGVLLVSLGADYSVFVMGRIWEEARGRDMSSAVVAALPRASRAVSIAAATLALSFAVLALVPVRPFQEIAFIMGVGVVVDAFLVRSFLLPALLVLTGKSAFWPHRVAGRQVISRSDT